MMNFVKEMMNPVFKMMNCSAVAKAEHWVGGSCQSNGRIWRPGRNLSAGAFPIEESSFPIE